MNGFSRHHMEEEKKILGFLKSRSIRCGNEDELYEIIEKALDIPPSSVRKAISALFKKGLISKSSFTSFSPTTNSSVAGFTINTRPPTTRQKHARIKPSPKPSKAADTTSLKGAKRLNGLDTTSIEDRVTTYLPQSGPCSCGGSVIRTPVSDMRNGTRRVICKCQRCGHGWSESSG